MRGTNSGHFFADRQPEWEYDDLAHSKFSSKEQHELCIRSSARLAIFCQRPTAKFGDYASRPSPRALRRARA
jgi:hypothetical protein